jgi:hypothetical protein
MCEGVGSSGNAGVLKRIDRARVRALKSNGAGRRNCARDGHLAPAGLHGLVGAFGELVAEAKRCRAGHGRPCASPLSFPGDLLAA